MTVSPKHLLAWLAAGTSFAPALAQNSAVVPAPVPTIGDMLKQAPIAPLPAAQPQIPAQAPPQATTSASSGLSVEDELEIARKAVTENDLEGALEHYLRALSRDPDNLDALVGAGTASVEIGDPNAAINFLARAERDAPRNGRIKAGLGAAMVQLIQPQAALKLFDEAVKLGVPAADIASDRGLAWDLRGDPKRARTDYEAALKARPDPETIRRLALSIAIAGDPLEALATLDPLLRKQDRAAWRARAFVLAISGDVTGAEETARAALQPAQAEALKPFFARLAQLRPNQKAAAVHFGHFPSEGRQYSDSELLAAAGVTLPEPLPEPSAAPAPIKVAERKAADPMADDNGDNVDIGEIVRRATAEYRASLKEAETPAEARAPAAAPAVPSRPTAEMLASATRPSATITPTPSTPLAVMVAPAQRPAARAPEPKPLPLPDPKAEARKAAEKDRAERARIEAAKEAKAKAAAAKANPSRHWVQVATGAYKPDLDKEWARLKDKHGTVLSGRSPWTTPLNRTNRLLVGPFKSADEAQAFVNKAAGSGFATSRFTSTDGQAVERVN